MKTIKSKQNVLSCVPVTFLLIGIFFFLSCATPVGVTKLDPKTVQRTLTANVLSNGNVSPFTCQILNRFGLWEEFQHEPEKVLARIHVGLDGVPESDRLFALAELSFYHASRSGDRQHFLSAACYAYAFLYPSDAKAGPVSIDPRYRTAVDLYNRSIAEGLTPVHGADVMLRPGAYKIPFGTLNIYINEAEFQWGDYRLVHFKQAAELGVRGLRNRYRWPGIGAPLTASVDPLAGADNAAYCLIVPNIKVPATLFLHIDNAAEGIKNGTLFGHLNLYTIEKTTSVAINGKQVPLEFEQSSALAYTLDGSDIYKFELKGLLSGDFSLPIKNVARFRDDLFFMSPYIPGRIPVVLVHGTASSPARWAEMVNELQNDRTLWGHYQFWLFTYNTGNPILYSGGILADALRSVVAKVDPGGKDPSLRKMVVIGHSQGGLLTRLMVTDSGDSFWKQVSRVPFEQIKAAPETKDIIRCSMFYTPLPFVKRVVYISTPHRGSYLSKDWVRSLMRKVVTLPYNLVVNSQELLRTMSTQFKLPDSIKGKMPTSLDGMSPENPLLQALAKIHPEAGVKAHSIIAVKPGMEIATGDDGVVEYQSAHIDGVESEYIVRASHSCQSHPFVIEEVRRILLEHIGGDTAWQAPAAMVVQ